MMQSPSKSTQSAPTTSTTSTTPTTTTTTTPSPTMMTHPPPHPNRLIPPPSSSSPNDDHGGGGGGQDDRHRRSQSMSSSPSHHRAPSPLLLLSRQNSASSSRRSSKTVDFDVTDHSSSVHLTRISSPDHLQHLTADFLSNDDDRPLLHVDGLGNEYTYYLNPMRRSVLFILLVEMLERFSFYGINYTTTAYLTGE
jgi:POT family proton-dependent oligopeptide transporter